MPQNPFIQEIKRRNIFKVASIYAVTAWLIIQVVATTFPIFELPAWSQKLIVILVLIGFPISLILAWAQESKAQEENISSESETPKQNNKRTWLTSVGIGILGIIGLILWLTRPGKAENTAVLPNEIKEERVAAIPFVNNTGNSDLDAFGSLCSSLITNGLTEAGIKTCSPLTVQQYHHLVGVLPNNEKGQASFSEVVGVRYWIEGYFLREGDSLTVKSNLTDGLTGDMVRNFPEIKGHIQQKEKLADELTRRIMGYWVAKDRIAQGNFRPPLYEAYQVFQKTYEQAEGIWPPRELQLEYSRKAFEMDSSFYLAALTEIYWLAGVLDPRADTLLSMLEPHYEKMTKFEQSFYNVNKAFYQRDYPAYSHFLGEKYKIFPKDESNKDYAFHLAIRENRPEDAWKVMNDLGIPHIPDEMKGLRTNLAVYTAWYGLRAGKYDEVNKMIDTYLKNDDNPYIKGTYFLFKSWAFIKSNRIDSVFAIIDEVKSVKKLKTWFKTEYDLVDFCNNAAEELLVVGNKTDAHKLLDIALKWALETPERMSSIIDSLDLAETCRLKGQPKKALDLETPFITLSNNGENAFGWTALLYYSGIGIDYALLGEKEKAEEILRNLLKINKEKGDNAFLFYCAARICAVLGKKEKAMEYINATRITGNNPFAFKRDYYMKNLYGYPPYETYLTKKGN
ncbi:MAG: hypothetical protein SFU99_06225 [Saprospiraceae bacterium]|nr:hypothetical protein [Saprospiraceae bacterium]